jgi:hypothetical protein
MPIRFLDAGSMVMGVPCPPVCTLIACGESFAFPEARTPEPLPWMGRSSKHAIEKREVSDLMADQIRAKLPRSKGFLDMSHALDS